MFTFKFTREEATTMLIPALQTSVEIMGETLQRTLAVAAGLAEPSPIMDPSTARVLKTVTEVILSGAANSGQSDVPAAKIATQLNARLTQFITEAEATGWTGDDDDGDSEIGDIIAADERALASQDNEGGPTN